nr:class E sortase [Streptomyces sp. BV286]
MPPYSAPQPPHVQPQASYGQPQSQSSYPDARSSSYAGPQPPYAEPQASFAEPPRSFTEPQPPFAASPRPYPEPQPRTGPGGPGPAAGYQEARTPYAGAPGPSGAPQAPYDAAYAPTAPFPAPSRRSQPSSPSSPPYGTAPAADETVALPVVGAEPISGFPTPSAPAAAPVRPLDAEALSGGRAARRKAARRHGKHGGAGGAGGVGETHEEQADTGAPLSRVAARRAAKARKPGAAVMASRAIGEVFITTGVLMLLFVTYQLWWTNIRANAQAGSEASSLQNDWANGKRNPGTFEPGQGFALLRIPKLDVVVPIAEGIDKKRVLDRGMVGHYAEKGLQTAMPDAKTGNFGLAGHRNTHGEPFRYINRLKPGDAIVVETQDKYFVYKMASILPVTAPSNTAVLDAIPKGSTFKSAGRYITLTTCTPEFTSKYRMIVWGTMVEERPRSEGKPDALVG